jgi:hypothetical protein
MAELRTFRLADGTSVVSIRGELDGGAVAEANAEIVRCCLGGRVIVDLLGAFPVDYSAVDRLVPQLRDDAVTVAATHAFLVGAGLEHGVRFRHTLANALA